MVGIQHHTLVVAMAGTVERGTGSEGERLNCTSEGLNRELVHQPNHDLRVPFLQGLQELSLSVLAEIGAPQQPAILSSS